MKRYRTDQRILYVAIILALLCAILAVLPPIDKHSIIGAGSFATLFLFGGILSSRLTYVDVEGKDLHIVNSLFFRHRIDIRRVSRLRYIPTWRFQEKLRSLYIDYEGGWAPYAELKNSQYLETTLNEIVYDLVLLNPRIELDEYSDSLMKTRES
jgi:hypothetical protein